MFLWLIVATGSDIGYEQTDYQVFKPFDVSGQSHKDWNMGFDYKISPKKSNASISIDFHGNEFWLVGKLIRYDSIIGVSIDNSPNTDINSNNQANEGKNILYHANLSSGDHIIQIFSNSKNVELHGIYYCLGHNYVPKTQFLQKNTNDLMKETISASNVRNEYYSTFAFEGDQLWIIGPVESKHKELKFDIDNQFYKIDLSKKFVGNQILYSSKLSNKTHVIKLFDSDFVIGLVINTISPKQKYSMVAKNKAKLMNDYTGYKLLLVNDSNTDIPEIEYVGGISSNDGQAWKCEDTGVYTITSGNIMRYKFKGSKVLILGYTGSWHGKMNVRINGTAYNEIDNFNVDYSSKTDLRFESDYLDYNNYVLEIESIRVNNDRYTTGISGFYVLDNGGAGVVSIVDSTITVNKGTIATIELVRKGGAVGSLTITVKATKVTATNKINYIYIIDTTITFEENIKALSYPISTVCFENDESADITYKFEILSSSVELGVSNASECTINLINGEKPPSGYTYFNYESFSFDGPEGSWKPEDDSSGKYTSGNDASAEISFNGNKFWVTGYKMSWAGEVKVSIDGELVQTINNQATETVSRTPDKNQLLYESPDLASGRHTVNLTRVTNTFGLNGIYVYTKPGNIEVSSRSLSVNKGQSITVELIRKENMAGDLEVEVGTEDNTAISGKNFIGIPRQNIVFAEGETKKTFEIQTLYYQDEAATDLEFSFKIFSSTTAGGVGTNSVCTITLNDVTPPVIGYTYIDHSLFTYSDGWTADTGDSGHYTSGLDKHAEVTFTGNKFWIMGYKSSWSSTKVIISYDTKTTEINNWIPTEVVPGVPEKNSLLFESEYLDHRARTVQIKNSIDGKTLGLNGIYVFNDNGIGKAIFNESIEVDKGETATVKIYRAFGSNGAFSINVSTSGITAINGEHYNEIFQTLEFADGVTYVEVNVSTIYYKLPVKTNFTFSLSIVSSSVPNCVGTPNSTIITIIDYPDPPGLVDVNHDALIKDGTWTTEGDMIWASGGTQSVKYEFTGTKVWVYGYKSSNSGFISIEIDESYIEDIDLHQEGEKAKSLIYTTSDLVYRKHTIKISRSTRSSSADDRVMITGLTYLNNREIGSIGFENTSLTAIRGENISIDLIRVGGAKYNLSVLVETEDGTAKLGEDYIEYSRQIEFKDRETIKTISIQTLFSEYKTGSYFNIRLSNHSEIGGLSPENNIRVNIKDRIYLGLTFINYTESIRTGNWELDGDGTYCESSGSSMEYEFLGTEAWILGYLSGWSGKFNIFVDNNLIKEIDTLVPDSNQIRFSSLYDTGILKEGSHKVRIEPTTTGSSVGINGIYYLDNSEQGSIKFVNKTVSVDKGLPIVLELERVGGIKGNINISINTKDISLGNDNYYSITPETIEFKEGETKHFISITTKYFEDHDPREDFKFNIYLEDSNIIGGIFYENSTEFTIKDVDTPCEGYVFVPYNELTKTGSWTDESAKDGSYTGSDGTYSMTFIGTNCYVSGYLSGWSGVMGVYLDGEEVEEVNTNHGKNYQLQFQKLYESPILPYGNHSLKITRKSGGSVGINGFAYLDNLNQGAYMIETKQYSVNKGLNIEISVQRVYNTDRSSTVMILTIDDTAKAGIHYLGNIETLIFNKGESIKTFNVGTIAYTSKQPTDYSFKCEIYSSTNNVEIIGVSSTTNVTIKDVFTPPKGLNYISYAECETSGNWKNESEYGSSFTQINGSTMTYKFYGSKAWLYGTHDPKHGLASVYVDGNYTETINTSREYRKLNATIFISEDLEQGLHTIVFESIGTKAFGVNGLYYLSNTEHGLFELISNLYETKKGETVDIEIVRLGGSNESVTVDVFIENGTAFEGIDYIGRSQSITFNENEVSKIISIPIIKYRKEILTNTTFGLQITKCSNLGILGFMTKTVINIIDEEIPYSGLTFINYKMASLSAGWDTRQSEAITSTDRSTMTFAFIGTRCWVIGSKDQRYGSMHIHLDDKDLGKVSTSGSQEHDTILFKTSDLKDEAHMLKIEYLTSENPEKHPIHINGIYYLDNGANGCIEVVQNDYSVMKGERLNVSLKRIGGSKGQTSIAVKTKDISAFGGINYVALDETVIFENGEIERQMEISTILFQSTTLSNLAFEVAVESSGSGIAGLQHSSAPVTIIDFYTPQGGLRFINYTELIKSGDWREDAHGITAQNNGDSLSYAFVGSKAWVVGSVGPDGGSMSVTIDGRSEGAVSTYSEVASDQKIIFVSSDLKRSAYKIILEKTADTLKGDKKLKISGLYILDNEEKGLIEFKDTEIAANPGTSVTVTLSRVGGSNGRATVEVIAKDGTALSGKHFSQIGTKVITFDDKQTTQTFTIDTIDDPLAAKNLFFTCHVQNPKSAIIGFKTVTNITIHFINVPLPTQSIYVPSPTVLPPTESMLAPTQTKSASIAPTEQGRTPAPTEQGRTPAPTEQGRTPAPTEQGRTPAPTEQTKDSTMINTEDGQNINSGNGSRSNVGLITGLVIALLVVIVIVLLLIKFISKRRTRDQDFEESNNSIDSEMETTDYFSTSEGIGSEDDPLWGNTEENPFWHSSNDANALDDAENDYLDYEESYLFQ